MNPGNPEPPRVRQTVGKLPETLELGLPRALLMLRLRFVTDLPSISTPYVAANWANGARERLILMGYATKRKRSN